MEGEELAGPDCNMEGEADPISIIGAKVALNLNTALGRSQDEGSQGFRGRPVTKGNNEGIAGELGRVRWEEAEWRLRKMVVKGEWRTFKMSPPWWCTMSIS